MHTITDTQFKNFCSLKMKMNAHFYLYVCNKTCVTDLLLRDKNAEH